MVAPLFSSLVWFIGYSATVGANLLLTPVSLKKKKSLVASYSRWVLKPVLLHDLVTANSEIMISSELVLKQPSPVFTLRHVGLSLISSLGNFRRLL